MQNALSIGVDLGGTKTEAVLLQGLDVRHRVRVATPQSHQYEAIVETTAALVERIASETSVSLDYVPVGVGMPGSITRRDGLVKNSNTTSLNGRPFRQDLSQRLKHPVVFDNDANCFALAEALAGAGKAHHEGVVFGVIMGTGVGGGVVLHGRVWSGAQGIAGEWGHHPVRFDSDRKCYCGQHGCLELYASGPGVEYDYQQRSGVRLPLADIVDRRGTDPHADAAIDGLLDAFGRGLATVIGVLDPSVVVLGGGVSNVDCLYDEGRERVARYVFNDELTTPIVRNVLGDSAGVIGAALLTQTAAR